MLSGGLLDGTEDGGYFTLQGGKVKVDDAAAGMEDDVDRRGEGAEVVAHHLAHAALDAVAIDGLAHDLAHGKAHARAGGAGIAERCAVGAELGAEGEEVAHLLRELLAAGLVDALIVGVFAGAEDDGSGCHAAQLDLKVGKHKFYRVKVE